MGAILAEYSYDPFGNSFKIQGSSDSEYRYAGYFYHSRSGLNFTLTRPYNSVIGRFINRDPIREDGGDNVYAYAWLDPISNVDPSGMKPTLGIITCTKCKKFELEEGDANFGRIHITNDHGPGVFPWGKNDEPQSTWYPDAWKAQFIDRILKDVLCSHGPTSTHSRQDVYTGAYYLVDVELQTGREVSNHAPVGLVWPGGFRFPYQTFDVTVVTTNNLGVVNKIITAYPGLP